MRPILIFLAFSITAHAIPDEHPRATKTSPINNILTLIAPSLSYLNPPYEKLYSIKLLLQNQEPSLRPAVINKVLSSLACAQTFKIKHKPILTVIDYSLPANQKRMWIFDLTKIKLLYNTYVSHGITSGTLNTVYFSNKNNSKASSIGVYLTGPSYYGREGLSLRLKGLDRGFNDNAMRRYIVMHGGWYMDENFIRKYGRPGRSWGCPSFPKHEHKGIINTIKDDTFLVIYYPSDNWFIQSKFLNCQIPPGLTAPDEREGAVQLSNFQGDDRLPILFLDSNDNNRYEQSDPIIVMQADNYIHTFKRDAPLKRMLRRQINNKEYIALSPDELNIFIDKKLTQEKALLEVYLIIPEVVKRRGVWKTLMKVVRQGKVNEIKRVPGATENIYLIQLDKKNDLTFKPTHHFIRWLGL